MICKSGFTFIFSWGPSLILTTTSENLLEAFKLFASVSPVVKEAILG